MKKITLLLLVIGLTSFQEKTPKLEAIYDKSTYPFWIQVPKTEEKLPLLLFLHGKSLSGTDLNKVKRYGVLKAIEKGRKINAIVVAPQVNKAAWDPDKLLKLVEYVEQNYYVDSKRIYVCGMSLGGYGTLHFAGKYPEKISAAVAICGGGNTTDGCRLSKVPLWILHGDKDFIVPVSESQKVYNAIKKCNEKSDATLSILKGENHGSVESLFHKDAMYDFMFKHVKE
jgi:predicted peptidase